MRIQTPMRPIRVDYQCPVCAIGFFRPTGRMLMSSPPQFPHKCSECGYEKNFKEKYPTIRYCNEGELLDMSQYEEQEI